MHCVLPFRTKAAFHDPQHTAVAAGVSAGRKSLGSALRAERGGAGGNAAGRARKLGSGRRKRQAKLTVLMLIDVSLTPTNTLHTDRLTDAAV
ncbi:hypothetical protein QQF64_026471 [Cirrhinus molitorella]|uniref:Uncharacterized protein n=1 Tax=Cirrhinus molitorella TaxID=172907 RepID=A0ABR3NA86_9TELE